MSNLTKMCFVFSAFALASCGAGGEKGESGAQGPAGEPGTSCSVKANADGTGSIVCTDGSSFNITNGKDGHDGDAGSDGQPGLSCYVVKNNDGSGTVFCPADGSSYTIHSPNPNGMPNGEGYDYCHAGYFGPECQPCHCVNGTCNDTTQGDGSCTCFVGYTGEDCATWATYMQDATGKNYKAITIGNQIWMAENMATDSATDNSAVTCYKNSAFDKDEYGCLYTFADAQKICPSGWHLPTYSDFDTLLNYVSAHRKSNSNFLALIAKSTAWTDYKDLGGDDFGFGALPAGYYGGGYDDFGSSAYFWSATEYENNANYAYYLDLGYGNAYVSSYNEDYAFSVRCLKDSP